MAASTVIITGPGFTSAGNSARAWCSSSTCPLRFIVFMAVSSLREQGSLLALRLVPVAVLLLAFERVPVYQVNRRRHRGDERRALDRLEALAAARGRVVLAAAEFQRPAARGFHHQHIVPI